MELSKQDVVSLIGVIKTTYINCYKDTTKADLDMMAKTWYDILKDYSKEVVAVAFKSCLQVCKFAPTLADIIEQIKLIENSGQPTEIEYWVEIEQAVANAMNLPLSTAFTEFHIGFALSCFHFHLFLCIF